MLHFDTDGGTIGQHWITRLCTDKRWFKPTKKKSNYVNIDCPKCIEKMIENSKARHKARKS